MRGDSIAGWELQSLQTNGPLQPRSLTASLPLKNAGWKTSLSYWVFGNFLGAMLNFGGGSFIFGLMDFFLQEISKKS